MEKNSSVLNWPIFVPYLYAKVDTTIKVKERQRSGASYKIIIDMDNTGKSRKKRRAS